MERLIVENLQFPKTNNYDGEYSVFLNDCNIMKMRTE